jgi:hypothetical protein
VRRTHPCFDRPLETIAWAMLSIVCSFRPVLVLSTRHLNLFQLLQPRCAADQRVSKCGQSVSSGSAASEQRALAHVCGSGHCPARRRAPRPEAATAPRALPTGAPPWRSWPRLRWTPWSSRCATAACQLRIALRMAGRRGGTANYSIYCQMQAAAGAIFTSSHPLNCNPRESSDEIGTSSRLSRGARGRGALLAVFRYH